MQLVVLNHCNQWHEYSSFRLIGVIEEDNLSKAIEDIKKECKYSDEDIETYIDISYTDLNELNI